MLFEKLETATSKEKAGIERKIFPDICNMPGACLNCANIMDAPTSQE